MTKEAAIHEFMNSFGIPAYKSTAVPDDVIFPYIVYQGNVGFYGTPIASAVQVFYYTDSEAEPNAMVERISKTIGAGGRVLKCDDGHIWVYRGSPWCTSQLDETSPTIKVRNLNIYYKFLTT